MVSATWAVSSMRDPGDVMRLGDPPTGALFAAIAPGLGVACPSKGSLRHVDLAAFDDEGQPLNVWPCRFCDTWHLQVLDEGGVIVREWHAETCAHYQAIAAEMADK